MVLLFFIHSAVFLFGKSRFSSSAGRQKENPGSSPFRRGLNGVLQTGKKRNVFTNSSGAGNGVSFMENAGKLQRILGLSFHNSSLYKEALTHSSYATERHLSYCNQRLELLGDAVIQIILTDYIFRRYPDCAEGKLSQIRSALVNQTFLMHLAKQISLGDFLLLGKGELENDGRNRNSTLCDAFEALMAAIYLDHGLETAYSFLQEHLEAFCPDPAALLNSNNPKGMLQEYTQSHAQGVPSYKVVSVTGPDHLPFYEVHVLIGNHFIASGSAHSRKAAERNAAEKALKILSGSGPAPCAPSPQSHLQQEEEQGKRTQGEKLSPLQQGEEKTEEECGASAYPNPPAQ